MIQNFMLLLPVILPILAGTLVLSIKHIRTNRKLMLGITLSVLLFNMTICVSIAFGTDTGLTLWDLTDTITITFQVDHVGRLFSPLTCLIWLTGIFSVEYMKHGDGEFRFFGFFLIVLGVLIGLDYSANLVTFYIFYELMTLTSLPLVLHELTKEAVMAGLKYLYYSIAGAFLALFGVFVVAHYAPTLTFTAGGVLSMDIIANHYGLLLPVVFLMILGFGTKAGMFPMHGWLPTAHSVAPAPASAVLSGLITKAGVLGIVRIVFYITGPDLIRGTWVQTVWMILTLLTVFMGSMLAYREPVLKKRLAYSTGSQVSYMLFGLSLLHPLGLVGALSHVVFHSLIKNALFLGSGAVIFKTGIKRVSQLIGIGKQMPVTIWCFTLVSLALVGIPPASGFVSKWYLAAGALAADVGVFSWFGPVVLLVSALLTAGYLLPVTIHGFFPGADYHYGIIKSPASGTLTPEPGSPGNHISSARSVPSPEGSLQDEGSCKVKKLEPSLWMLVPMLLLTAGAILLGMFPRPLIHYIETIAASVM